MAGTTDGYSVTHNVPVLAETMHQQTDKIISALNDLQISIRPMAETWQGEARTAWEEIDRIWTQATTEMEKSFGKAGVTLQHSFDTYRHGDKKIALNFSHGR
jgi:WXG100 family type VII secretion target